MILEQQSEHGGVRVLRCGGEIIGIFAYAREEELEIREPLILRDMKGNSKKRFLSLQRPERR